MANENQNQVGGPGSLQPGDKIDKYEVLEVLGAGGQSIVYKCRDELLDRLVAIKQICTPLAQDPDYLQQLRNTIRTIAKLGSKNEAIITIYELIENQQGLFYVMEFVEGHTLETLIREADGPIETKALLLILFRMAAALHEIHNAGIVHRDIKPSNIVMTPGLRPKMIDFGVAAIGGGDASMPLATTKYLAPELYSGGEADGRADIYSLGFIAYEMLLGRDKFNEVFADIVRDKHSEALRWMKWHGNEAVTAPLAHEVNPSIPLPLSHIVARMMEKNPDNRFASAEELGRAIKTAFSPKGRRAGPISQLSQLGGIGTLEGDELEYTPAGATEEFTPEKPMDGLDIEGPATAPLPKEPMTRRTKITLIAAGAFAFLVICSVVAGLMISASQKAEERRMSAANLYRDAAMMFKDEQFAPSLEKLEIILKRHPSSPQAAKASILAPMCRARLAIAARKWNQAQLHENDATVAAERLQEKTDDKKLVDWLRNRLDDIVELRQYRYSSTIYWEAMSRARAEIKKVLREEDFDRIRKDLETAIGAPDVNLTQRQESDVAKLRQSIERERFLFLFRQAVELGKTLLAERRYDEAEARFKKAQVFFGGDYAAAKFVSRQQQQQLLDEVDRQLRTLQKRREDDRDIAAYNAAKTSGDVDALEVAIRNLLRKTDISADDRKRFTAELKTIEINKELAKARQYTTQGNITAAKASWQRILALSPGHAEATAALVDIDKAIRRSTLMNRGEKAFTDRKFDEALELFRQAAALGKDTNVAGRITDCLFEIEYAKGRQLARNRKYDQAAEAYNLAKEVKPAEAVRIDGIIDLMRKQQQYENFIIAANAALANKKYDQALVLFDEARKVDDTAEVAKGIRFTNYSKYMHLARQAKEAGDNKTARWQARRAMKVMDTPEVRAFLESVGGEAEE